MLLLGIIYSRGVRQGSVLWTQSHFTGYTAPDDGLLQRLNPGYHGHRLVFLTAAPSTVSHIHLVGYIQ